MVLLRVLANDKGGPVKDLPTPPAPVRTPATPETSGHLSKESDLSTANTTSPSDVSGSTTPKPVNSHSSRSLPPPRKSNTPPYPPPSPPKSPSPPPIKTPSTPLPGLGSQKRPLTPSSVPKPRNQRIFVHSSSANPKASTPITTPQTGYTDYDERTLPALKQKEKDCYCKYQQIFRV
ncbi:hypothetical protein Avbf_04976 [Armadillidium vulgare]|nr:hypothetical protein Avbf_04976 [Armadillidium vulgare]